MAKVSVTKSKLDSLANAVAAKSGESVPLTVDEMTTAVLSIDTDIEMQSKTITPTESSQIVTADNGYDGLSSVQVGAISSTYIGSEIVQRSSTDLSASGDTVTVPSGYYESEVTKAVPSGTAGTPTATKGTASNGSITVTPSVTNTTGFITGSTKTGTTVTVSASELDSGTKSITANGTGIDVVGYATVDVNVSGGSGGVSITDGMVITEWDTNGTRPKAVEIYGNVPNHMFGQYNNASSLGINLTSVTFHNTVKIGAGAFQRTALVSITIPDSVNSIGEQCFRGQTALAHYVHENARDLYGYNKPAVKALQYGLSHLEDMQLGAVGKPVTALYKDAFVNNQAPSTAVVTIYTTGDRVDTLLTAMRVYLTAPTIIIKASEATTYGGTSYAAGDTIVTSTP